MNKTTIILLSIIAALLVVGAFVGGWFARGSRVEVVTRTDTLTKVVTIRDTVTKYKPHYITRTETERELVYIRDTIRERDSLFAALQMERREYADSNYRAVVRGFRPELEEISVYPKTQIITTTITQTIEKDPPRFSFSVQLGAGAQYDLVHKEWGFGPYVGGGVSVRLGKRKK